MTTPTNNSDIRWQQRRQNFERALEKLEQACQRLELNELEAQGLIKAFEYTYELAWNMLRDDLLFQGNSALHGSRDTLRLAFERGLIRDGEDWMLMLQDRNLTVHAYNDESAQQILVNIRTTSVIFKYFGKHSSNSHLLANDRAIWTQRTYY